MIREALAEALTEKMTVKVHRERHPYGSTVAVEELVDWEIDGSSVFVLVEDGPIPLCVLVNVCKEDHECLVRCTLCHWHRDRQEAEYDVELL